MLGSSVACGEPVGHEFGPERWAGNAVVNASLVPGENGVKVVRQAIERELVAWALR
jgi:hypothetical protein